MDHGVVYYISTRLQHARQSTASLLCAALHRDALRFGVNAALDNCNILSYSPIVLPYVYFMHKRRLLHF